MHWCLVELILVVLYGLFTAIFRVLGFLLMLMITSIASLFVGVDVAVERIAYSWIEQSAAQGVNLGYGPTTRGMVEVVAVLMLIAGWVLDAGVIYLVIALLNSSLN